MAQSCNACETHSQEISERKSLRDADREPILEVMRLKSAHSTNLADAAVWYETTDESLKSSARTARQTRRMKLVTFKSPQKKLL